MTSIFFIYIEILFHCTIITTLTQAATNYTQSISLAHKHIENENKVLICSRLEAIKKNLNYANIWINNNSKISKKAQRSIQNRYIELTKLTEEKELNIYRRKCAEEYGDFNWHYEKNSSLGKFFPNWIAKLN